MELFHLLRAAGAFLYRVELFRSLRVAGAFLYRVELFRSLWAAGPFCVGWNCSVRFGQRGLFV